MIITIIIIIIQVHVLSITHSIWMTWKHLVKMIMQEQTGLLTIVKGFSDEIQVEVGLDKCSKATFKKGKLTTTENIHVDLDTSIQTLEQESIYKYLGVNEGDGIQHAKMKEKIRKECYRRIRIVTKSELNAINRVEAINTLAIPVVAYIFNIVDWKL